MAVVLGVPGVNRALHAALLRGGLGNDGGHLHHGVLPLSQLRLLLAVVQSPESRSARASSSSAASAALYQLGRLVEMLPAGLLLAVELLGLGKLLLRTQLLVRL